jgi:IS5 family transposase
MATDDFFRNRLDQMIDLRHPLAVLARRMPWGQIEAGLAPALAHRNLAGVVNKAADLFGPSTQLAGAGVSPAGQPSLSIRLMAPLLHLKHAFDLSDEALVERWAENVVWQYFSGSEYYEPRPPCDPTQIGRFRRAIGEAGVEELLKATIDTAASSGAVSAKEFERVVVDSTVQVKAIGFPTGSQPLEIARHHVVKAAKAVGIVRKRILAREGNVLQRWASRYAHAQHFKRPGHVLKRQRTSLGILLREGRRKLAGAVPRAFNATGLLWRNTVLARAERLRVQKPRVRASSTRCMPRRWSASARARPASPMRWAPRPVSPSPTAMDWWCGRARSPAIRTTEIRCGNS